MDISSIDMTSMLEQFQGFDISSYSDQIAEMAINSQDQDGDMAISQDELGFGEELFSQLDSEGDGSISQEEVANGVVGLKDTICGFLGMLQTMNQSPDPEMLKSLMGDSTDFSMLG